MGIVGLLFIQLYPQFLVIKRAIIAFIHLFKFILIISSTINGIK